MTRLIVSGLALFAIAGFAALTVEDAVHNGVSLLGIGVVGALAQQPPDDD